MIKRKVKLKIVPIVVLFIIVLSVVALAFMSKTSLKSNENEIETINDTTVIDYIPVVNTKRSIINPYMDSSVTIGKNYYDYKAEEEKQKESILVHDNTYIQNNGVDFISKNEFEVISILEGTVVTVRDDDLVGKIVEIKHDNGYISIYQSLKEVNVKKGDIVNQGQVIGKSGTNELDKELGNHLHFELYVNDSIVNPMNYLNKEIDMNNQEN